MDVKEWPPVLELDSADMQFGAYIERELFTFSDEIETAWNIWLEEQADPGNYDYWKDRERQWSDYIDGRPKYWAQTYMPAELVQELVDAFLPF